MIRAGLFILLLFFLGVFAMTMLYVVVISLFRMFTGTGIV